MKIADNAHNSRPDRVTALKAATGTPINPRYARARQRLYAAVPRDQTAKILTSVAPPLLDELEIR